MTVTLSPVTAPALLENRVPQYRQAHTPAGQLALQQPSLVSPVTARVAVEGQAASEVRDRNRDNRKRRRDPGRGGLIDREF